MRKSASHGGLPSCDAKHDPKQRRALLRHISFIKAGFPQIVCLEQTAARFRAEDRFHQLRQALQKGDTEKAQKLCAVALGDPALANTELVGTCKQLLRQMLQFRKVLKDGQRFLQAVPWEYPAEQVDFHISVLRNSQWGPGVWDEELMAKAKIMRDADLLKLLRSVRPLNDDGSLKTHVDLHRCIRVWLTLTEAGVLSEHLSRMLLLRLCECGKAGVALGMALAEPWLLWRYNGSVQLAFAMEELWKHLWKRGQLNKSSDLKVVPILQGRASGLADLSAQLQAQRRELLLKGPLEALHLAQRILEQEQVGTAMEPGAPDAEAARVATVLCVIPSPALVVLARQGLFTILLRRCSAAPAPLAAALQVCALGVSLSLAWSPKSVEGSAQPESSEQDSLGKCLTAAADQLERISYPKVPRIQEQADMKEILSAVAQDLDDKGQLTIETT